MLLSCRASHSQCAPWLRAAVHPKWWLGWHLNSVFLLLNAVHGSLLALAYGLAGVGYIISATFLPVIARPPSAAYRFRAGVIVSSAGVYHRWCMPRGRTAMPGHPRALVRRNTRSKARRTCSSSGAGAAA